VPDRRPAALAVCSVSAMRGVSASGRIVGEPGDWFSPIARRAEVVTDDETFHTNVEVSASACEIEQCGVALRKVDAKPPLPRRIRVADTAFGISINSGDVHHLEGKAKGPQPGETINESCTLPRRLRASA